MKGTDTIRPSLTKVPKDFIRKDSSFLPQTKWNCDAEIISCNCDWERRKEMI